MAILRKKHKYLVGVFLLKLSVSYILLLVVGAAGNDHVSKLFRWNAKLLECGLDKLHVLVEHEVHVPTKLVHVPEDPLGEAAVGVRVNKQLHVKKIANLRRKIIEHFNMYGFSP